MPKRSYRSGFSSTSKAKFISGFQITQNQGGGERKAGLIPSVGNDSQASLFRKIVDPINGNCCTGGRLTQTLVFTRNLVRPISSRPGISVRL